MSPPKDRPLIIFLGAGKPPIGSWHQRIKMLHKGFSDAQYRFIHLVPYFAPTYASLKISPPYIHYCLKPVKKRKRNIFTLLKSIWGTVKAAVYIYKAKNVAFIIIPGLNFLQGFAGLMAAKLKNIRVYAEIADEYAFLNTEQKRSAIDRLAKYNQLAYEKFILKKVSKIFVFTSYLENKYKKMFPHKNNIIRTTPSLIDLKTYDALINENIKDIAQPNISLLDSDKLKFVYAGACNRTNGLFFFLDAAAKAKHQHGHDFLIFFFMAYGNVDKVVRYCETKKLTENVFFFEPVPFRFIPAIYSKADILVLPEHGNIIANAGFPGKTSELLASGKAILATNFSDLKYYLKNTDNAMIAEVGDSETYLKNLLKLLTDDSLRKQIGIKGRQTALQYFNCADGIKNYL